MQRCVRAAGGGGQNHPISNFSLYANTSGGGVGGGMLLTAFTDIVLIVFTNGALREHRVQFAAGTLNQQTPRITYHRHIGFCEVV